MLVVPVKDLLEAGVHFGCRASRWNPKMEPFIFGRRNLIHIIDLKQTLRGLIRGTTFLQRLVAEGRQVLFVGTKRQAQGVIQETAKSVDMPYVTERWLGGTLTNFSTIRGRLRRLEELEQIEAEGSLAGLSKKRLASLMREKRKIFRNLDGIRQMEKLPGALVVVDPRKEHNAVKEATKLGIPVVAILDTDCDPEPIDIPIPGNDDSLRSIQLLLKKLAESVEIGRNAHAQWLQEEEKRRQEDAARKAEEAKKLEEARKRRREERARLEEAQRKIREEKEAMGDAAPPEASGAVSEEPKAAAPKAEAPAAPPADAPTGETQPGPSGPESAS